MEDLSRTPECERGVQDLSCTGRIWVVDVRVAVGVAQALTPHGEKWTRCSHHARLNANVGCWSNNTYALEVKLGAFAQCARRRSAGWVCWGYNARGGVGLGSDARLVTQPTALPF